MVKLRGPMMSMAASGTLADTITFATWKGRPYARERVIPSNPQTGAQTGRRAMMKWLTQSWVDVDAPDRATYQDIADGLVASTFNAFISENLKAWHNFLAPSFPYPATRDDDIGTLTAGLTPVWEENRIGFAIEMDLRNDNRGLIIFASATGDFDTSVGNAIMVLTVNELKTYTPYWTPPSVQEWFFDHRLFSNHGTLGPEAGEESAAP